MAVVRFSPTLKGLRNRLAVDPSRYEVEALEKLLTPCALAWDFDISTTSNELNEPFYAHTSRAAHQPQLDLINGAIKGSWDWGAITNLRGEQSGQLLKGGQAPRAQAILLYQALQPITFAVPRAEEALALTGRAL